MGHSRRRHRLSRGRWELERERFQLPAECAPPPDGEPAHIGEVAAGVLRRAGLESRVWERTVLDEWHSLVGEAVARRARPGEIRRGVMTVFVSNSAWMNELARYGKKALLDKLQHRFGSARIKDIRFAPDPDVHPGTRAG